MYEPGGRLENVPSARNAWLSRLYSISPLQLVQEATTVMLPFVVAHREAVVVTSSIDNPPATTLTVWAEVLTFPLPSSKVQFTV